jgi:hypothetical protein
MRTTKSQLWVFAIMAVAIGLLGGEAQLKIVERPEGQMLRVEGGTSNVQYQIWTSASGNVAANDWYYWRRAYSVSFLAKTNEGEILINGTNTTYRPQRFFMIRGVLPD